MLINVIEHNAEAQLLSFIEDINSQGAALWGLVAVQRDTLKNISNDEVVLTLKPCLQDATKAKIFFAGNGTIYVVWFGMLKQTYEKLKSIVSQSLCRSGTTAPLEKIVHYYDPSIMGNELNILLKNSYKREDSQKTTPFNNKSAETAVDVRMGSLGSELVQEVDFKITPAQTAHYKKMLQQRSERKQPHILIVEDSVFLRNLLAEVLRKIYVVDSVPSAEEGWKIYLSKAPDIIFLDIELLQADGHFLAQIIKEVDPAVHIVMVTASHYLEDVNMAKKNHVDGFIVKPFNNKKIDECINRYMAKRKLSCEMENF